MDASRVKMIAFPGSENIKEVDHVLGCENRELSKKDALGRVQEQKTTLRNSGWECLQGEVNQSNLPTTRSEPKPREGRGEGSLPRI